MALIQDHKVTVLAGVSLNILFMLVKFGAFLISNVNLFFADAIDSFVDCFVILLIVIFLRFDLNRPTLTFLNMDMMFFAQWSVILVFRVIIALEQVQDLLSPEPRQEPMLIIVVSSIIIAFGVLLAILFVDEDDVVKFFIPQEEKHLRRVYDPKKKRNDSKRWFQQEILPVFAEALDNLVTAIISLIVGILLYFDIASEYVYLIDDVSNIVISVVLFALAASGIWKLSAKYAGKSHFKPFYAEILPDGNERELDLENERKPLMDSDQPPAIYTSSK